jgi:hypothetical protein
MVINSELSSPRFKYSEDFFLYAHLNAGRAQLSAERIRYAERAMR